MSAEPVRHLRVVNADTGEIDDGPNAEVNVLRATLKDTESALAKECRTSAQLRGQLAAQKKRAAGNDKVLAVMDHWHKVCRDANPNVKVPLDCKRADAVRKMLASFTPEALCEAIDGAHLYPYDHYGRRFCEAAPGRARRDDLDFICADVKRVELFRSLLVDGNEAHEEYRRYVHELCLRHPLIVAALAMLAGEDPHGEVLAAAARWAKANEETAA